MSLKGAVAAFVVIVPQVHCYYCIGLRRDA